jgi:hypothetical protein
MFGCGESTSVMRLGWERPGRGAYQPSAYVSAHDDPNRCRQAQAAGCPPDKTRAHALRMPTGARVEKNWVMGFRSRCLSPDWESQPIASTKTWMAMLIGANAEQVV